jgi:hypothetical protein
VLETDTGKSESGGYFCAGQPAVMCAFGNLDRHNGHSTHSFPLSGVRGSNCDCTATYCDMTPERRKCAVPKAKQRHLLLDNG